MKELFSLFMFLPIISIGQTKDRPDSTPDHEIRFENGLTWAEVEAKASNENKYIFIDAFATWCAPCKMMDRFVYTNDTVARLANAKFISVKLQMDSTVNDNDAVKCWYRTAKQMAIDYGIQGYPSFLFFTPDGKLAYKDIGFKNVPGFTRLMEVSLDPLTLRFNRELEEYRRGNKHYESMGRLSLFVKKVIGDKQLAKSIAQDYKKNQLDHLSQQEVFSRENFDFIREFPSLVHAGDPFFSFCYMEPGKVDSLVQDQGWAHIFVGYIITSDELMGKMIKDKKPLLTNPNWQKIELALQEKYPNANLKDLVERFRISYYQTIGDWKNWYKYKDKVLTSYTQKEINEHAYVDLNVFGAWATFINCTDPWVLEKTLKWIDMALQSTNGDNRDAYFDTKAALLYKLGRVREAEYLEQMAIDTAEALATLHHGEGSTNTMQFKGILQDMKAGKPTYLDEGAVWDAAALQRIANGLSQNEKN